MSPYDISVSALVPFLVVVPLYISDTILSSEIDLAKRNTAANHRKCRFYRAHIC